MPTYLENETALVRKAREGNAECFGVLVKHYERRIYRLGYAVTRNAEDAEEVLQETFLKAFTSLKRFNEESRFHTWLVRIAMNEAITKLRRRHASLYVSLEGPEEAEIGARVQIDVEDGRENPEEGYSRAELRGILSAALLNLDTRLRLVFVLRDIEVLSSEETARVLGLTVATVKGRLLRARLKLRKSLSAWFKDRPVLPAK